VIPLIDKGLLGVLDEVFEFDDVHDDILSYMVSIKQHTRNFCALCLRSADLKRLVKLVEASEHATLYLKNKKCRVAVRAPCH